MAYVWKKLWFSLLIISAFAVLSCGTLHASNTEQPDTDSAHSPRKSSRDFEQDGSKSYFFKSSPWQIIKTNRKHAFLCSILTLSLIFKKPNNHYFDKIARFILAGYSLCFISEMFDGGVDESNSVNLT